MRVLGKELNLATLTATLDEVDFRPTNFGGKQIIHIGLKLLWSIRQICVSKKTRQLPDWQHGVVSRWLTRNMPQYVLYL